MQQNILQSLLPLLVINKLLEQREDTRVGTIIRKHLFDEILYLLSCWCQINKGNNRRLQGIQHPCLDSTIRLMPCYIFEILRIRHIIKKMMFVTLGIQKSIESLGPKCISSSIKFHNYANRGTKIKVDILSTIFNHQKEMKKKTNNGTHPQIQRHKWSITQEGIDLPLQ